MEKEREAETEGKKQKLGGKNFGEKERRVDKQRGEDKKREEKFWKQREEATTEKRRGRATTTGYRDTNATRSTNTAALSTP